MPALRPARASRSALAAAVPALVAVLAVMAPSAPAQAPAPVPPPAPPLTTPVPPPTPSSIVSRPSKRTLYEDGPSGRFLLDGTWLFRGDPNGDGAVQGWQLSGETTGWTATTVPNAWNASDESLASFTGAVGWYRRDFRLPETAKRLMWVVRFEAVNYRAKIWLNGKPIGTNTGAYLPFELRLPTGYLRRSGVNRLVIRVDSRRSSSDFPPAKNDAKGRPLGGWWNYGGILREVYLRKIDSVDFTTVDVNVDLPCSTCAARIKWLVTVRNASVQARKIKLTARFGSRRIKLGTVAIGAKRFATVTRSLRVPRPRLWHPDRPYLYDASLLATIGKKNRKLQAFTRRVGVRSVRVSADGRMLVNGRPLAVRGVGLQEDSRDRGFAIDNATRELQIGWARELGATLLRAHYPLHPYTMERADELGLMIWSEVPVYQVDTAELAKRSVRDAAVKVLEGNVIANRDHPSILLWSIGNELSARPGPVQSYYISRAAAAAKALDPTRPVALAFAATPTVGCRKEYAPLDVIGVNDYFGWYPGTNGVIADRDLLSEYLDSVRTCYPTKAIMVSEFGAEANRDGPEEERGTFAFQSDFVRYHLGVYATKPWLSGAIYWALQEFRVRPEWNGGNPRPEPPIHQKGVVTFDGARKPAFADLQQAFRSTTQIGTAARRRR